MEKSFDCNSTPQSISPPYFHHPRRKSPVNHGGRCFGPTRTADRPVGPTRTADRPVPIRRPNFTIYLRCSRWAAAVPRPKLKTLLSRLNLHPQNILVSLEDSLAGSLNFQQWVDALCAMASLWESRLGGTHRLTPVLVANVVVPSDNDDLEARLRTVFSSHVKELMGGELVRRWEQREAAKSKEIAEISKSLGKSTRLLRFEQLIETKKTLVQERESILNRIREFKNAMRCILSHLGHWSSEEEGFCGDSVNVFSFDGDGFDWERIHALILRECKRFEDELPIYAHREEIMSRIHVEQQVMVLIGETGSGKSTQLVQFLADSAIAADRSIVCTQPRKIAAMSLANRVREECNGCYEDNSIICYPTFSSAHEFDSKIVYMTDHCLLQHYMNDKNLSRISCIVVDEAHERSLNTDLLLALLKDLLCRRYDLRLVIMSATANAKQLADYFFGCQIFYVKGRHYPVEVRYVPPASEENYSSSIVAPYVHEVLRMASEINRTEKEGTILAFLTSQMEVEWVCENFKSPSAVALPFHGKLSFEEQFHVFQNYPGKRKIIFATNLAETSLTIPGVKFVIDSGMVKESRFESATGINMLRVCWVSKSSADQRAGRAGRTAPGICYRLYSKSDFESMSLNQEPEIRRVHLGVAVLRILALGINNVQSFEFVDAPSPEAIDMASKNLIQLGAVESNNDILKLTRDGEYLVKMGIEPRLGKLVISCFYNQLGREGLVLAAVMANSSCIFCRVGSDDDKLKADCRKVQFCHPNGDLFTLLSVYKEWSSLPREKRNMWCWDNSINAKSLRRCQETVRELETCLEQELRLIIPSYWLWDPRKTTEHDKRLKMVILSALSDNVAMFSGYDQAGYEVVLTGQLVKLHPSCSLHMFAEKPPCVVFGELLSVTNPYLVCVTAFDFQSLTTLYPSPPFDVTKIENRKMQVKVISNLGTTLLKKFCGKSNSNVISLVSRIRTACMDERISVEVNVDRNEILLFASSQDMSKVTGLVDDVIEYERKWLLNECAEKCLYSGPGTSPPVALLGSGAEIKHLELEKRFLSVDVFYSNANSMADDKELLMFLEKNTSGSICTIQRFMGIGQVNDDKGKWGRVTFLTPDAARKASELNGVPFNGISLKILPSQTTSASDSKMYSFPGVKARVSWPRRLSKGLGIIKCDISDVDIIINDLSIQPIGGRYVRCEPSRKSAGSIVIHGLDKDLSDDEILEFLRNSTERKILDFFLVRGDAVETLSCHACEEELLREISRFMPKRNPYSNSCRVQVFPPEPRDAFMKALIVFDGRLHLEAAKALEQLEGKVLLGCLPWQKIKCQRVFHSSLSCPAAVYSLIKEQLDSLLTRSNRLEGAECKLERNANGSYRVRISANATKTVADLRRPIEEIMQGKIINDASLTPAILQHLFSRDGINLKNSVQRETQTFILFDRHTLNLRIFGTLNNIAIAQQKLLQALRDHHDTKQNQICLRGGAMPPDLMKEVVKTFGPDLHGLKKKIPEAEFTLNTRRHVISIRGDRELKPKVEEMIYEMAHLSTDSDVKLENKASCPICLCEVEEGYRLEACGHLFCRACLFEQCDSALKSLDSFPLRCAHESCRALILFTDLKSLLLGDKMEELFRASLGAYVVASGGRFRFCPSPDCPSIYRVAGPGRVGEPFVCGACYAETCTGCHLEHHPYVSCERYKEFKEDPDLSLKEWRKGKQEVKNCPVCGYTIEKIDGCNHIECKCGRHICWVCLENFDAADDCYGHLRFVHSHL